jgi:hypothetical protein
VLRIFFFDEEETGLKGADHLPFRIAGLSEAFAITCISDRDIETANQYYEAMQKGANIETLLKILSQAPIFVNYH